MESWIKQLEPIITEFKDGDTEPLSRNDVDRLAEIIRAKINLHEGNITERDYDNILDHNCVS